MLSLSQHFRRVAVGFSRLAPTRNLPYPHASTVPALSPLPARESLLRCPVEAHVCLCCLHPLRTSHPSYDNTSCRACPRSPRDSHAPASHLASTPTPTPDPGRLTPVPSSFLPTMRSPRPHGSGISFRGVDTSHDEAAPPFRRAASEFDLAVPADAAVRALTANLSDGGGRHMQHIPMSMPALVPLVVETGPKLALPDDIDAVGLMQPALTNKVSDLLSSPDLTLELVRVLELHGKVTSVVLAFLLRDIQLLRTCSLCCTRDLLW